MARYAVVEQPNEKRNSAWNVDKRIEPIDEHHQGRVRHEELLNGQFPEDMPSLLQSDQLKSMLPSHVHSALYYSQSCECSAQLIHPVDQCPIPRLDQERELSENPAEESVAEYSRVRRIDSSSAAKEPEVSRSPWLLL